MGSDKTLFIKKLMNSSKHIGSLGSQWKLISSKIYSFSSITMYTQCIVWVLSLEWCFWRTWAGQGDVWDIFFIHVDRWTILSMTVLQPFLQFVLCIIIRLLCFQGGRCNDFLKKFLIRLRFFLFYFIFGSSITGTRTRKLKLTVYF